MASRTADRRDRLLQAGLALSSELSLSTVLQRIVDLAVELTGARYGALGVLGADERIREFITVGVTAEERAAIGHGPVGRGILGALIREAKPLRIAAVGDDPRSVGFPPNHPRMSSFLGAPVKALGKTYGNIYLTEKQGADEFTQEDEDALVVLAAQAGTAVANAHLYEESELRRRWLESIAEINSAILAGDPLDDVLRLIVRRAVELAGGSLAMLTMPAGGGRELAITVAHGPHAEDVLGMTIPEEESISGEVLRSGKPVFLEDAGADDRTYKPMVEAARMGPALFLPLVVRGRPFGTLAVAAEPGAPPFAERQGQLTESFAGQASLALEYAEARETLERLALMEDRERIAKELHDGVIQSLFAVGMGLQGVAMLANDTDLARRIEDAVEEVDRVIHDLRNYIFGLRPGILAEQQLGAALAQLGRDFEERTGVVTIVEADPAVVADLAPAATDLVQLTREALSNVGRHAEAATVRVSLRRDGDGALLEIDDDGRGFDVSAPTGNGLPNIRERVESLGGSLEIESRPGDGTVVRAHFPAADRPLRPDGDDGSIGG